MLRFGDADFPWQGGYGLGVAQTQLHGHEVWGHGGLIPGFASELFYLPREHVTIAVVANETNWPDDTISPVWDTASALVDAVIGNLDR